MADGKEEKLTIDKEGLKGMLLDKFVGTLLGQAVGDALGAPVEFRSAQEIAEEHGTLQDMKGGGHFNWRPGEYTDDTSMMLCIAESLVACQKYDAEDIARRFVGWYKTDPKDIGGTTRRALARLAGGVHYTDSGVAEGRANGSLMRCAPLSLLLPHREYLLAEVSKEVSGITHAHPEAKLSCVFVNLMIARMVLGAGRQDAYQFALKRTREIDRGFVRDYLESFYEPNPAKGLAVNTLLLAIACFMNAVSFEEAVVKAVNLGGDADTTGAVTGALAGAYFGAGQIPRRWSEKLNPQPAEHFVELGKKLFEMERK